MLTLFTILVKFVSFGMALVGIYVCVTWNYEVYYNILHLPSLILLVFGLFGMLFAINHFRDVFNLFVIILTKSNTSVWHKINYADSKMEDITRDLYSTGVASLKTHIEDKKMPEPWKVALSQIEAKVAPEDIVMLLERQVFKFENNIKSKMSILLELSILAPSLGMFGTVIGLIKLLSNLQMREMLSQNMALALVTTLYGIFFANMIITPLKNRMNNYRISVLKSYEQIDFWLNIIRDKKPIFYISQDFTEKKSEKE